MFHAKNCIATVNLIALVRCFFCFVFFIAERNFVLENIIAAMFISEFILTSILFATILRRVNAHSGQGPAADRVPALARYASRFCQLSRLGADSLVPRPSHFFIPCSVKRRRGEGGLVHFIT